MCTSTYCCNHRHCRRSGQVSWRVWQPQRGSFESSCSPLTHRIPNKRPSPNLASLVIPSCPRYPLRCWWSSFWPASTSSWTSLGHGFWSCVDFLDLLVAQSDHPSLTSFHQHASIGVYYLSLHLSQTLHSHPTCHQLHLHLHHLLLHQHRLSGSQRGCQLLKHRFCSIVSLCVSLHQLPA